MLVEKGRGMRNVSLHLLEKECVLREVQSSPVTPHHDGLNVLLNISMKHVLAEPITIVYPHPQALHSLVLQIGGEVYLNYE